MNSDGSWDIEDWSYGYSKFGFVITGTNYILKYIKMENCCFDQINEPWREFFQKNVNDPKIYVMRQKAKKVKFYQFNVVIMTIYLDCGVDHVGYINALLSCF